MTPGAATWTEQTLDLADQRIHLLRGGGGDPLVLLHRDTGNPGWLPLHERLSQRFTVYAPTHPGFGASDRPAWARSVRDLALLYRALLTRLGLDQASVVGLGFGGWIAAELATMCPRLFRHQILVGAMGVKPTDGEILDQFLISTTAYVRAGFASEAPFVEHVGEQPDLDRLEGWEVSREMVSRTAWQPYMYNPALPHLLPHVDVPTLVVWGSEDRVVPVSCGERYVELLPDARLEIIEGAGHAVELERPDDLAALIERFIGRA